MLRYLILLAAVLAAAVARAQDAPPAPPQAPQSLATVQAQRNIALDWHAQAMSQVERLQAENAQLKAKIEILEKQAKPKGD